MTKIKKRFHVYHAILIEKKEIDKIQDKFSILNLLLYFYFYETLLFMKCQCIHDQYDATLPSNIKNLVISKFLRGNDKAV